MTAAHDPETANRVGACALGLAFAGRDDAEGLRQLIDMAGACPVALEAARSRLDDLGDLDRPIRRRAAGLLDAAGVQLAAADAGADDADGTDDAGDPGTGAGPLTTAGV